MKKQELDLEQKIELWKGEYRNIFQTTVADEKVIWRTLKRGEYIELMTTEFDSNEELAYYARQEEMAKKVILFPEDVNSIIEDFAGVAEIISNECMVKSGFGMNYTEAL